MTPTVPRGSFEYAIGPPTWFESSAAVPFSEWQNVIGAIVRWPKLLLVRRRRVPLLFRFLRAEQAGRTGKRSENNPKSNAQRIF
jgi:hypothetical protein